MSSIQLLLERERNYFPGFPTKGYWMGGETNYMSYPPESIQKYSEVSLAGSMARMPTLKERLALAVTNAEDQLANAKEAKEIFDRNPDLERLLDLMQKGRF